MAASETETRITPWFAYPHYGQAAYRIHQRRDTFGMWQRHEWERADGSINMEAWIAVSYRDFLPHAEPMAVAA